MDNHYARLLFWLLISLVTCMKHIDSQPQNVASPIQRGINDYLDVNELRFGSYHYAGYRKHMNREFIGIKGSLNVWLMDIAQMDFSGAQISIGEHRQGIYISAGWMVNEEQFHDKYPRLFASYTTDNSTTICYSFNAACNGFVMTNARFFDHQIQQGSIYDGHQVHMDLEIVQDVITKNWALHASSGEQTETVGHWLASSFPGLNAGASRVEWMGFVFRSRLSSGPTPMGNGGSPTLGYNKASHIRFIQYKRKDHEIVNPTSLLPHQTDPAVYGLGRLLNVRDYGVHFFYGGLRGRS